MPAQKTADQEQTDGIEQIGRADEVAGQPLRQEKGEIEKDQSQFVRQIVNTIHNQTEAAGLESGDSLADTDGRIQDSGGANEFAIVSHMRAKDVFKPSPFWTGKVSLPARKTGAGPIPTPTSPRSASPNEMTTTG